jgi:hypothetical protein
VPFFSLAWCVERSSKVRLKLRISVFQMDFSECNSIFTKDIFLEIQYKYRYLYIYINTYPYEYMHAYTISISTSERLSRLDLEIHKVDH